MSKSILKSAFQAKISFSIIFTLFLSIGVSTLAQTPDGMTPAEEDSCRGLYGSAFGLCNAFCEAQDCNNIDQMDWNKSCYKLLDNYEKITGTAGPPCYCDKACRVAYNECLADCDTNDPNCCPACGNTDKTCEENCCNQQIEIDYNICVEDCNADPECNVETECIKPGGCFSIPPPCSSD